MHRPYSFGSLAFARPGIASLGALALRRLGRWVACATVASVYHQAAACADDPLLAARYTTDLIGDVSGGERRDAHWIGRLDVTGDTGTGVFGIAGAHAYGDLFLLHGGGFSTRVVGDAQVVSNVDAPHAIRLFEAWVEAPLGGGLRTKVGWIDLNSEFDVQSVGALFLNSSFGIAPDYSQSGLNGPSIFPVTSPGLVMALDRGRWAVRAAIFDAVPGNPNHLHRTLPGRVGQGGALLAIEGLVKIAAAGEVQFGQWRYTDRFDRLDGRGRGTSTGSYAQFEQKLLGNDEVGALRGWVRIGKASTSVNPIGVYAGGGFTWGTKDAEYGVAVAHARLGNAAQRAFATQAAANDRAETTFELTAYRRIAPWFAVQPDIQLVRHPSWGAAPDALIVGLRMHFDTARQ
jgi:porin